MTAKTIEVGGPARRHQVAVMSDTGQQSAID
jgi:hypothetical protein